MSEVTPGELATRLKAERHMVIVSHESADGDALGCVLALGLVAESLGIPCRMHIPGTSGFPAEYAFLPGVDRVQRGSLFAGREEGTLYVLDCASAERLDSAKLDDFGTSVNVDHHQDNTLFGDINLLDVRAGSTTQILYEVFASGGIEITREVATALYVGLVTDTGRFQYSSTTPRSHEVAGELLETGLDVAGISRNLYQNVSLAKSRLLRRVLERMQIHLEGALAISRLTEQDFTDAEADDSHVEGLVDHLRALEGVRVGVLVRERNEDGTRKYRVSLRATDEEVNVAEVAHLHGGGGHKAAAGFSTEMDLQTLLAALEQEVGARL